MPLLPSPMSIVALAAQDGIAPDRHRADTRIVAIVLDADIEGHLRYVEDGVASHGQVARAALGTHVHARSPIIAVVGVASQEHVHRAAGHVERARLPVRIAHVDSLVLVIAPPVRLSVPWWTCTMPKGLLWPSSPPKVTVLAIVSVPGPFTTRLPVVDTPPERTCVPAPIMVTARLPPTLPKRWNSSG